MKSKKEMETNLNDLLKIGKKVLTLLYVLLFIVVFYTLIVVFKETGIIKVLFRVLAILAPLFIGVAIAWVFDPAVKYFIKKGTTRVTGATLVYLIFIGVLVGFFSILIPAFSEQFAELSKTIPSIISTFELWVDNFFEKFSNIDGFDHLALKADIIEGIEAWGRELPKTLPMVTFNFMKSLVSGIGVFGISLIVGFYVLISYENATDIIHVLTPKKYCKDVEEFTRELNVSLRGYVKGTALLSLFIFITTYIAFTILGLKGALIFAMFCGLTNIIPYLGPWIGGSIAAIVGLSQSLTLGLLILVAIFIIQSFESVIMYPLLMGRSTKFIR